MFLKRWIRRPLFWAIVTPLLILIIAARLYLGVWLTHYVNGVLADVGGYRGSIAEINIDLYRGAYRIEKLKLNKMEGRFPVPFLAIDEVDFSLQWAALIHGRIVMNARLDRPVINFAVNKTGEESQTGTEIDWTQKIRDLMPIDINEVLWKDGKITYRDFSAKPQVDIFIAHMDGEVYNLRNVVDKSKRLPSYVKVAGDSIGGGKLFLQGRMNILKQVPDFDLKGQLENVDLPALNDYTNAAAAIDFRGGKFSVYSQMSLRDNHLNGYIKPIATDIKVIDLKRDKNPIKLVWESVASFVIEIFTNQHKDQFATKIDVSGTIDDVHTSTWSAIGGILHNAFVQAFEKKID